LTLLDSGTRVSPAAGDVDPALTEAVTEATAAIARAEAPAGLALDAVHLRCGDDLREGLRQAGLGGRYQVFADPYCQGPVPRAADLPAIRARFISQQYGLPLAEVQGRLKAEYAALAALSASSQVVLWFEHDSYDQLILAAVLASLAARGRPARLELVCTDHFPGVARFIGLGQLPPPALRALWERRQPVTAAQLELGSELWEALREPSPDALHGLACGGTPALPLMGPALRRHLAELPGSEDGLALSERLSLELLAAGPRSAAALFRELNQRTEPLPFLGDLMYWAVLQTLASARRPALAVADQDRALPWPRRRLALTGTGRALLVGDADWLAQGPAERWIGGIRVAAGEPAWRWDRHHGRPLWR